MSLKMSEPATVHTDEDAISRPQNLWWGQNQRRLWAHLALPSLTSPEGGEGEGVENIQDPPRVRNMNMLLDWQLVEPTRRRLHERPFLLTEFSHSFPIRKKQTQMEDVVMCELSWMLTRGFKFFKNATVMIENTHSWTCTQNVEAKP